MKTEELRTVMLAIGVVLVIGLPLCAAQPAASDEPPIPYVDIGACPFEGCVYREWTALAPVVARQERRTAAAVVFNVNKGERVTAITGVVVTTRPGRVLVRRRLALASSSEILRIEPGQTLFLLTYQGEGFTKAWFQGRFYSGVNAAEFLNARCEADPDQCAGQIVERPQSVWWVQIRNDKGQFGWTDAPDRFDGKDALAN